MTRKIERQMIQAIIDKREHWTNSNTRVEYDKEENLSKVFLHGHRIGEYDHSSMSLALNNCGYETVTTKSRLNALLEEFEYGAKVFQKNWDWFIKKNNKVKDFPSGAWYSI
jgi:hypothetical protein